MMNERFFRGYWNKASKNYMDERWHRNPVVRFDYAWTKKNLLKALRPTARDSIFEVGCGPGTWTEIVAIAANDLTAVDISDGMARLAKRRAPRANIIVGDVMKLKTDRKFDKIFSARVIEYVFDKPACIRKLYDMLKPKGRLVIITKSSPNLWDLTSKSEWQQKVSPGELVRIMRKAGFRNVRFDVVAVRPPVFSRGVYEAKLVPHCLERYALGVFDLLTKAAKRIGFAPFWLAIFSESYIVSGEKA